MFVNSRFNAVFFLHIFLRIYVIVFSDATVADGDDIAHRKLLVVRMLTLFCMNFACVMMMTMVTMMMML